MNDQKAIQLMEQDDYETPLSYWANRYQQLDGDTDPDDRFFVCWQYGDCLGETGKPEQAVRLFQEAEACPVDVPAAERTLLQSAICFHALEADWPALSDQYFDQIQDVLTQDNFLINFYHIAHERVLVEHPEALNNLRTLLNAAHQHRNEEVEAATFELYSNQLLRLRKFDQALRLSDHWAPLLTDHNACLLAYLNALEVYFQQNDRTGYLTYWDTNHPLLFPAKEVELDPTILARRCYYTALVALHHNALPEAEKSFREALAQVADDTGETLQILEKTYQALVNFQHNEAALPYYQQALERVEETGDNYYIWDIKVDYAVVLHNLYRYEEQIALLQPIIKDIADADDFELYRRALSMLWQGAIGAGNSSLSEQVYQTWNALEEEVPAEERFNYHYELGRILPGSNQLEQGYRHLLLARQYANTESQRHHIDGVEKELALVEFQMGHLEKALERLSEIDLHNQDLDFLADYYVIRANAKSDYNDPEGAEQDYLHVLQITEQRSDQVRHRSSAYCNLGLIYHERQDYSKAEDYYQKGYDLDLAYGDAPTLTVSLHNLGSLYLDREDYSRASEYLEQALTVISRRFAKNETQGGRKYTSDAWTNTAEMLAEAWIRLGKTALAYRLTLHLQQVQSGWQLAQLHELPLPKLRSGECLITYTGIRRERMLVFYQVSSTVNAVFVDLKQIEQEHISVSLANKINRFATSLRATVPTQRIKSYHTIWPDLIRYFHHRAQRPSYVKTELAQQIDHQLGDALSRILFAPIHALLPASVRSLIIRPDYLISIVPMSLLRLPVTNESILRRFSLRFLGPLAAKVDRSDTAGIRILGCTHYQTGQSEHHLPDLKAGRQEAAFITQLLPTAEVHLDDAPTLRNLPSLGSSGELSSYRYLHFIGHAIWTHQQNEAQFLWSVAGQSAPLSLTATQISHWKIRAELVYLSACSTGQGQVFAGWGIDSLGQAFLQAGAQAVITSLWTMADEQAAILGRELYRHLESYAPAEALCIVQRKCQAGDYGSALKAPYYWAGLSCWERSESDGAR